MWQGKTHRQSDYREGGVEHDAISSASNIYLKEHFEAYTWELAVGTQQSTSESTSTVSHCGWPFLSYCVEGGKYALDHNIHLICLPSKSTHLLQPLYVGCIGVLQTTYEKNLSAWLRNNPLSVISKVAFLEIIQKTRVRGVLGERLATNLHALVLAVDIYIRTLDRIRERLKV